MKRRADPNWDARAVLSPMKHVGGRFRPALEAVTGLSGLFSKDHDTCGDEGCSSVSKRRVKCAIDRIYQCQVD